MFSVCVLYFEVFFSFFHHSSALDSTKSQQIVFVRVGSAEYLPPPSTTSGRGGRRDLWVLHRRRHRYPHRPCHCAAWREMAATVPGPTADGERECLGWWTTTHVSRRHWMFHTRRVPVVARDAWNQATRAQSFVPIPKFAAAIPSIPLRQYSHTS